MAASRWPTLPSTAFDKLDLVGDEATGASIVREALTAPLRQIAVNAGLEGGVVAAKVADLPPGQGLNASTGEYVDMFEAGIVEPAKVTRSALQNAASVVRAVSDHRGRHRRNAEPLARQPDMRMAILAPVAWRTPSVHYGP